ncbi:MAG: hypothetical protein HOY71_50965 [Nonomuraea sp.]|nr:hypothetical protein [Nonomuraea sp.]
MSLSLNLAALALVVSQAAAPVPWEATHGAATASGTRWTERPAGQFFPSLVVQGTLTNTSSGCSSVWVQWVYDLAPGPARKQVTQCGAGSTPVSVRLQSYSLTTTGYLWICAGQDSPTADCGERISLTSWPVRSVKEAS